MKKKIIIKELCKNKVSTAKTTEDAKTGAKVMTYTSTRKCSADPLAIQEEETEQEETEEENPETLLAEPNKEEEAKEIMEGIKKTFSRFL